jgi:hypothetical protein
MHEGDVRQKGQKEKRLMLERQVATIVGSVFAFRETNYSTLHIFS